MKFIIFLDVFLCTSGKAAKFHRRRQKAPAAATQQLPSGEASAISLADISADISDTALMQL